MNSYYKIKHVTKAELDIIMGWAAKEKWNPGLHDAFAFYATDPTGFFIGYLNDIPISCISAVSYSDEFGFIGFYIVKSQYRGKGYGIQIWNKALEYLKNRNIGLDGVLTQQENYKQSGFKLAHKNIRFKHKIVKNMTSQQNIISLDKVNFADLISYDSTLFPVNRKTFIKNWINLPESTGLAYIDDKKIMGYGLIRKCEIGYKIGPLFSNNEDVAEKLYLNLTNSVKSNSLVYLDIPEVNTKALKLVKKYNMIPIFETARMYTREIPQIDLNMIYGITTFELG